MIRPLYPALLAVLFAAPVRAADPPAPQSAPEQAPKKVDCASCTEKTDREREPVDKNVPKPEELTKELKDAVPAQTLRRLQVDSAGLAALASADPASAAAGSARFFDNFNAAVRSSSLPQARKDALLAQSERSRQSLAPMPQAGAGIDRERVPLPGGTVGRSGGGAVGRNDNYDIALAAASALPFVGDRAKAEVFKRERDKRLAQIDADKKNKELAGVERQRYKLFLEKALTQGAVPMGTTFQPWELGVQAPPGTSIATALRYVDSKRMRGFEYRFPDGSTRFEGVGEEAGVVELRDKDTKLIRRFDGKKVTLADGKTLEPQGPHVVAVADAAGKPLGKSVQLDDLFAAKGEARANLAWDIAKEVTPDAKRQQALASYLRDSFGSDVQSIKSVRAEVQPDGTFVLVYDQANGGKRVETAKFAATTPIDGKSYGQGLVVMNPGSPARWREYLDNGDRLSWSSTMGMTSGGVFTSDKSVRKVDLNYQKRNGERYDTVSSERKDEVVESLSGTSGMSILGGAIMDTPGLGHVLKGFGVAGKTIYSSAVGAGQAAVGGIADSDPYRVEAWASLEKAWGWTTDKKTDLSRTLPKGAVQFLDSEVMRSRHDAVVEQLRLTKGITEKTLPPDEYNRLVDRLVPTGTPSNDERLAILQGHFGAGSYGGRILDEVQYADSKLGKAALTVAGGGMSFAESTAENLPLLLATAGLGRVAALAPAAEAGTVVRAGLGTARVANTVMSASLTGTWIIGGLDNAGRFADALQEKDFKKSALAGSQAVTDMFFAMAMAKDYRAQGKARELAELEKRQAAQDALLKVKEEQLRAAQPKKEPAAVAVGVGVEARGSKEVPGWTVKDNPDVRIYDVESADGKAAIAKTDVKAYELDMLRKASTAKMPEGVDNVHIAKLIDTPKPGVVVMEKAPGVSLKEYTLGLREWPGGKITPEEWAKFKAGVLSLKEQGVEHTDLKNSENVMVWRDGAGKLQFELIDWGGPVDPEARMPDTEGLRLLETELRKANLLDAGTARAGNATPGAVDPKKLPAWQFEKFVRSEYGIDTGTLKKSQPKSLQKILEQYIAEKNPSAEEVRDLRQRFTGQAAAAPLPTSPTAWRKNLPDGGESLLADADRLRSRGSEIKIKSEEGTGSVFKDDFRDPNAPKALWSGQKEEILQLMLDTGIWVPKLYHEGKSYASLGGVESAMRKHVTGDTSGFISVSSSRKGASKFGRFLLEIDPKGGDWYSTQDLSEHLHGAETASKESEYITQQIPLSKIRIILDQTTNRVYDLTKPEDVDALRAALRK